MRLKRCVGPREQAHDRTLGRKSGLQRLHERQLKMCTLNKSSQRRLSLAPAHSNNYPRYSHHKKHRPLLLLQRQRLVMCNAKRSALQYRVKTFLPKYSNRRLLLRLYATGLSHELFDQ